MDYEAVKVEKYDGRAVVTLNRPEKKNALSFRLQEELLAALLDAEQDAQVHCIIICGAGEDFCAGYDLADRSMYKSEEFKGIIQRYGLEKVKPGSSEWQAKVRGFDGMDDDIYFLERGQRFVIAIHDMHKPVIACVHGQCLAGGLGLASMCDIIVASENALFGFPAARDFGVLPTNMLLYHAGAQWTKRMLLTGDNISGSDAAKVGLILKALPDAEATRREADAIADRMARIPVGLLSANKRSVNLGLELMGARTMQRLNIELDARGHLEGTWYGNMKEKVKEAGSLPNLFKQRNAQFGDGRAHATAPDERLPSKL